MYAHFIGSKSHHSRNGGDRLDSPAGKLALRPVPCLWVFEALSLVFIFRLTRYEVLLVPGWFPGMQWRKDARVYKGEIRQMFTRPWDRVVREEVRFLSLWVSCSILTSPLPRPLLKAAGIAPESFARDMMRGESNKLDAETQMQTAATMCEFVCNI